MFGTLGPMISPIIGGALTDTLGWRSVFGFALCGGAAITLTVYLAMYETHPVEKRTKAGDMSVARSYIALLSRLRFNAFVLTSGFNTGAFMVMASASASLMTELLHAPPRSSGSLLPAVPDRVFPPATSSRPASAIGYRARR